MMIVATSDGHTSPTPAPDSTISLTIRDRLCRIAGEPQARAFIELTRPGKRGSAADARIVGFERSRADSRHAEHDGAGRAKTPVAKTDDPPQQRQREPGRLAGVSSSRPRVKVMRCPDLRRADPHQKPHLLFLSPDAPRIAELFDERFLRGSRGG